MRNNCELKSIFKENVEKFSGVKKRLEKLTRMTEENKLKNSFDFLKDVERKYAEATILINNQEKNLFGNLLKNVVNENEDEVKKNEKIKNALLVCIRNALKNVNLEEIEDEETKEGIDFLTEKYKDSFENEAKNGNDKMARLQQVLGNFILFN